jgi:hypothetical protein
MSTVEGHALRRASVDCWLCQCGFAVFGAKNDRDAGQRHSQHIGEVMRYRAHIKQAQKDKRQSDFADSQERNWCNPFGQGLFKER